ncbi:5-oxoprolinase subunit PxpB [Bacillus sp. REN3]|uniref:5-oxoprolinase subunit PxpB n=1 Tax=Bacillus sp. REN3 TaxID=2802440 RepID=UPI001AED85BF|nr:5-oxoprolinase subunit PxpB [Bacillus sp. REN3]
MEYRLLPLGDQAIVVEFGTEIATSVQQRVQAVAALLDGDQPEWMVEYVPAFTTITIFYDPAAIPNVYSSQTLPYHYVSREMEQLLTSLPDRNPEEARAVEIPVCYGGEFGPDLEEVAKRNGLSAEEVIDIHSSGDYLVYMIGFAPGFPFIGGMSDKIAAPRKETPRLKIPAGSVGIAGKQTGVYPIETPGGWQLIGRTPLKLFRPEAERPSLLKAGDKIKFTPISLEEYREWEKCR